MWERRGEEEVSRMKRIKMMRRVERLPYRADWMIRKKDTFMMLDEERRGI